MGAKGGGWGALLQFTILIWIYFLLRHQDNYCMISTLGVPWVQVSHNGWSVGPDQELRGQHHGGQGRGGESSHRQPTIHVRTGDWREGRCGMRGGGGVGGLVVWLGERNLIVNLQSRGATEPTWSYLMNVVWHFKWLPYFLLPQQCTGNQIKSDTSSQLSLWRWQFCKFSMANYIGKRQIW